MGKIDKKVLGQMKFEIGNVSLDVHVYEDSDDGTRYTFIDVMVDGHVYRKLTISEAESIDVFEWEDCDDAS